TDELLMVEDALGDDRFVDNPLVTGEPHIRFYAGMPLVTPDGYRLGAVCAIDTTPRVLSEDQKVALGVLSRHVVDLLELRLRNRELKEVSEYKSRLLAIIAHDMRSPLNNLTSLLRLLEVATISNEQEKDLFGDLDRAMQATRGLLDNLTEWVTRILDGGANSVCPERFDLRETVSSLVDQVKPRGAAKGVTLENRIPEGVEIESDRGILRFILRNLMDNAIKYSPGGRVTVTAEDEAGVLGISVGDTGVGMSPEKLSELFKWHERSPVPGTDGERGSGIALMLSAEMASLLGAALSAESTLGEGTTVTLTIPFSQGA
ncbi:MAG: GAF domain-containing sensor histidine kinase, partial [Alkalispirochaetaceae bacterium]